MNGRFPSVRREQAIAALDEPLVPAILDAIVAITPGRIQRVGA